MLEAVCNPSPAAMVQGLVSVFIRPCHLFVLSWERMGETESVEASVTASTARVQYAQFSFALTLVSYA